ncbi:MAG: hypothetical protein A4E57_00148 [Syntrophorhabdaceae bacterium PtaU1.Bin034]|nr:MAG: hypothetical protein A4E57_00148 [Syntrophorhabdaceae bacterium PtaU1.Bin034]
MIFGNKRKLVERDNEDEFVRRMIEAGKECGRTRSNGLGHHAYRDARVAFP